MAQINPEKLSQSKPLEGTVPGVFRKLSDMCLGQLIGDSDHRKRITDLTLNTVENLNSILNISYPVSLTISTLQTASQNSEYYGRSGGQLHASFYFRAAKDDVPAQGVLTLDRFNYLKAAASNRASTPWDLIADLAHEMHHGHAYDIAQTAMNAEQQKHQNGQQEYNQLRYELMANLFAFKYVAAMKPVNFTDRVRQWLCLKEIRDTIKIQKKARRQKDQLI